MCFEIIFYFRVSFWDTYEKQGLRLALEGVASPPNGRNLASHAWVVLRGR